MKAKYKTIAFMIILIAVPAVILVNAYSIRSGFLGLILFGQDFKSVRLQAVNMIAPPDNHISGYDGQFYAQIALDPLLMSNDTLKSVDYAPARARRIGLPFLAFILGVGKPAWILQVYALLNFVFWFLLLAMIYRCVGLRTSKDFLLAISVLWSTGTLTSLTRSLTDLPAAVLITGAVLFYGHRNFPMSFLGFAALCRETSVLSFPALIWPDKKQNIRFKQLATSCLILIGPLAAWLLYVYFRTDRPELVRAVDNLAFPLAGIIQKLMIVSGGLWDSVMRFNGSGFLMLLNELICPVSLLVQSAYFMVKRRWELPVWRAGIGFSVFIYFLGSHAWGQYPAYSRIFLPLTIFFNLLVRQHEYGRAYIYWYVLGNIGLFGLWIKMFLWNS
ncbi:MAG: hypothetical protein A3G33_00600 [Omnitrophica bacterium RIFCSPLOWO2_12_FULL_44_17]|uniref:Glycosyltransferase RgtA/B/C/D-like domain-containing protein n=1 Tax=Candidatus Danuiimicrobium aquiferis TaxID=1801832 RepID=A0A1G1L3A0_9BACT|nr:MAG: hypothetical protein A3B72_04555 [Omnitrophica bacterium RIFCSPHIGHO2_02_FULL_45_28]OGW99616.1 MAG: hypothetical protein A3G33_00600 [Omnitrophica bacterium RIFCSPLOWO2_12_FULL_44_17]OGX02363.1 MAG: hypothetical protein A3J12_10240 [Omnitrophica bacterium RIFCSPLOWO2_02_FULL_44_11]